MCLLTEEGEIVGEFGVPPDPDGLRGLIKRVGAVPVLGVIESMTGARWATMSSKRSSSIPTMLYAVASFARMSFGSSVMLGRGSSPL